MNCTDQHTLSVKASQAQISALLQKLESLDSAHLSCELPGELNSLPLGPRKGQTTTYDFITDSLSTLSSQLHLIHQCLNAEQTQLPDAVTIADLDEISSTLKKIEQVIVFHVEPLSQLGNSRLDETALDHLLNSISQSHQQFNSSEDTLTFEQTRENDTENAIEQNSDKSQTGFNKWAMVFGDRGKE